MTMAEAKRMVLLQLQCQVQTINYITTNGIHCPIDSMVQVEMIQSQIVVLSYTQLIAWLDATKCWSPITWVHEGLEETPLAEDDRGLHELHFKKYHKRQELQLETRPCVWFIAMCCL